MKFSIELFKECAVPADLVHLQATKLEDIDELLEPKNDAHRKEKCEQLQSCMNSQSFDENLRRMGIEL